MKKLDSALLVCTTEQSQKLTELGINSVSAFCYGKDKPDDDFILLLDLECWPILIPAWTMEEINILIGPLFLKPDLFGPRDWKLEANMMQYAVHMPKRRANVASGAQASAIVLIELLKGGHIKAEEANARMEAFISKEWFNPQAVELEKSQKK